jgi:Na+-translocating ferredoxin:NAD+ oxidoreductase RnfG subunit
VNWRAQFVGEDDTIALAKSGGNIDALSGATITSRSVTNATATAIKAVESLG